MGDHGVLPMTAAVASPVLTKPLWNRDFTYYFGARVVSLLGDAMMPVAAALAVGALYGVSGVGYVLAVWTAPFVLFVVFGGVFSDRLGARTMMIGADVVRAVTQGVVAVAFIAGTPPLWLLLATSALAGLALAGVLMTLTGPGAVYAVDAATFVVSGACLTLIGRTPVVARSSTVLHDLRRGWTEFRSRSWMWSVIVVWLFFGVFVFGPY